MPLDIRFDDSKTPTVSLSGRLDTQTAPRLDELLDGLHSNPSILRLVFDLKDLDYMSSAGIRCLIRARKIIEPRGGKVAVVNVQPPVRKVLDIVKAIPAGGIFKDAAELDEYLDDIQRQMREGD